MKKPHHNHASAGGDLSQQLFSKRERRWLNDPIADAIRALQVEEKREPRTNRRLRDAIERFRYFLCGQFGLMAEDVEDMHVALFAARVTKDFSFMYRHFHGIGSTTTDELADWADAKLNAPLP